jgi:hypothetical protein
MREDKTRQDKTRQDKTNSTAVSEHVPLIYAVYVISDLKGAFGSFSEQRMQ